MFSSSRQTLLIFFLLGTEEMFVFLIVGTLKRSKLLKTWCIYTIGKQISDVLLGARLLFFFFARIFWRTKSWLSSFCSSEAASISESVDDLVEDELL